MGTQVKTRSKPFSDGSWIRFKAAMMLRRLECRLYGHPANTYLEPLTPYEWMKGVAWCAYCARDLKHSQKGKLR